MINRRRAVHCTVEFEGGGFVGDEDSGDVGSVEVGGEGSVGRTGGDSGGGSCIGGGRGGDYRLGEEVNYLREGERGVSMNGGCCSDINLVAVPR